MLGMREGEMGGYETLPVCTSGNGKGDERNFSEEEPVPDINFEHVG